MSRALAALLLALVAGTASAATQPEARLAFVRLPAAADVGAVFVHEDGRTARLPIEIEDAAAPAWAPGGRRLAFEAAGAVYVAAATGKGARRLVRGLAPAWAPDGSRLAFVRARPGSNLSSVWTVGADGSRARRLTYGSIDLQPSWSRDGRTLAFLRIHPKTYASGVWTVRADGRGLRRILPGLRNVTQPVWSPTAGRLVVSDGRRLIVARPDGRGVRVVARLTADAAGNRIDPQPSWSPDGRRIAFAQLRRGGVGRSDIWVVGADGADRTRITRSPGSDTDPSWR
jgi:Tol biopolymer transport system component